MPIKVKINCTVNSYPEASINWIHNYINLKETNQQTLKKLRQALDFNTAPRDPLTASSNSTNKPRKIKFGRAHKQPAATNGGPRYLHNQPRQTTRHTRNLVNFNSNSDLNIIEDEHLNNEMVANSYNYNQVYFTSTSVKYNIIEHTINETFKQNMITINIENESDFGVYECYANNSAGSKTVKFYIFGGRLLELIFYNFKPKNKGDFYLFLIELGPKTTSLPQTQVVNNQTSNAETEVPTNSNSNEDNYKHNYHQAKTLKNDEEDITLEENLVSSRENSSARSLADLKQNALVDTASFDQAKSHSAPALRLRYATVVLSSLLFYFNTL
jgi:hypothetical protein